MLDKHPALKRVLINQYQGILVGGAIGFTLLLGNPLPLLVLLGGQMATLPWLYDRARRRLEIEKKHAGRQQRALSQEEQYRELPPASRQRFLALKQLCDQITTNYRSLSSHGQSMMAEQGEKLDVILVSCLRRLWLLQRRSQIHASLDTGALADQVRELEEALATTTMDAVQRDAWQQNLDVKRKLLEEANRNAVANATLVAELDTIESLLQLLLQKSLAASDAATFAQEIDDALVQAETDAASVREMESLAGTEPLASREPLAEALRSLPPPPPPLRVPEGGRDRRPR